MKLFLSTLNKNEDGFTLLEILIALTLIALTYGIFLSAPLGSRKRLEESIENIERAIRFAADETALRNRIMRLRFQLSQTSQEYFLDIGPDYSFVLPVAKTLSGTLSSDKNSLMEKQKKEVDSKFSLMPDYESDNAKIPEGIKIIGIGIQGQDQLLTEGSPSLHFYPSGEKDWGIIILAGREEMMAVSVDSYSPLLARTIRPLDKNIPKEQLEKVQLEQAQTLFFEFSKKRQ